MDAGSRIKQAFQKPSHELSAFLHRTRLNAMTTLTMMFQNPAVPSAEEAAEESIKLLFEEMGGHCQDAALNESQCEQFLDVHRQAVTNFRQALDRALEGGVPANDRKALAIRIAQLLNLPI